MRWQVRAEEWEAVNDLLGAARRQARQTRRSAVPAATRVCETAAVGGGRPLARNAPSGAAHSLSGSIRRTTSRPTSDKALKRSLSRAEPKVRIQFPPAESHQRTELGEFRPREGGFPMVSS